MTCPNNYECNRRRGDNNKHNNQQNDDHHHAIKCVKLGKLIMSRHWPAGGSS